MIWNLILFILRIFHYSDKPDKHISRQFHNHFPIIIIYVQNPFHLRITQPKPIIRQKASKAHHHPFIPRPLLHLPVPSLPKLPRKVRSDHLRPHFLLILPLRIPPLLQRTFATPHRNASSAEPQSETANTPTATCSTS